MVGDLDRVLALKASAKSSRDDGDWEVAIDDLKDAIQLLDDRAIELPSMPSWLASELADTYGLIGGIEKRWGLQMDGEERQHHLKESVAAYDMGFGYERDLEPSDANTYNRVNRIVGRVLLDAHVLGKDGQAIPDIAEDLRMAEEILIEQIGSGRQKDPWAYCDLATVRLLRGKQDALATFRELDRLRPPSFVYESALTTLQPLCKVASDLRPDLVQAVTQLRRSARYSE
jgi:hypothetical protein